MSDIKIKEIREKHRLTQEDFAAKLGVSVRTVSNWENGGVIPSTSKKKIQMIFGDNEACEETIEEKDNIGRLISIMEKDHQLIRDILEKKDETIDRLLSIVEAEFGIGEKDADAAS